MRGQKPEERGSSSLLTDHSLPSPSMQRPEELLLSTSHHFGSAEASIKAPQKDMGTGFQVSRLLSI